MARLEGQEIRLVTVERTEVENSRSREDRDEGEDRNAAADVDVLSLTSQGN